ncbi:MAG: hypothetical protein QOI98_2062, partial [Solirubrobacteraceae bacterium]|nr:hypothetical protein [Solirubrobacteraceae bacterium]
MATTDLRIGSELAGYRIEALIGRGGMGVVYRAEDLRLGRKVALKLLAPELVENEAFKVRFDRESRLAAAIDHPNIIPLYEAREAEGLLFIAMRYVEGTDLRAVIAENTRLDPMRAVAMVGQVAGALDAAHQRGLVHRDVKPANVLVTSGTESAEHCYLTDFGLTKDTSSSEELTEAGQFVGTLEYVAPEQIESDKPDGRADLYALACVMFECLTGAPPFKGDSEVAVMYAHLHGDRPRITSVRPDLPEGLDHVLMKALARAPADRYASCSAFVAAVRSELDAAGFTVVSPKPSGPGGSAPQVPAGMTRIAREPAKATRPAGAPVAATRLAGEPAPATQPAGAPVAATRLATAAPERRLSRALLAAAVVAVVAAGAVGAIAGKSGGGSSETPAGNVAAAGNLRLSFPASWASASDPKIPGLKLASPLALAPRTGAGKAGLVAGEIKSHDARLLPSGLASLLPSTPARDAVQVGGAQAFRYRGLQPKGFTGSLTLYVVATSAGVEGLACFAPTASSPLLGDCDDIAATLTLSGAQSLDVRPNAAYARGLSTALATLATKRAQGRTTLQKAKTAKAQAAPATTLAAAYRAAQRTVHGLNAPALARALNDSISKALTDAASAYDRMAAAARGADSGAFTTARGAVSRAEQALSRALDGLAGLGYKVNA